MLFNDISRLQVFHNHHQPLVSYDYTDPDRLPAAETTCIHYLSLGEFAERANISVNTMKGYRKDGRLPGEDGEVGRNRGWLPETADEWIAALAR